MPGRYEIVDEPESMEVAEDDVYNPDQSVREISSSMRSLEPIFAGSVSLKYVFYDPRWSRTQRQCCIGIIGFMIMLCLAILIALFVGLGKVVAFIEYTERIKNSGLTMIPSPSGPPDLLALKICPLKQKDIATSDKCNNSKLVKEIDDELLRYSNMSCNEGSAGQCKFDFDLLGQNCTKSSAYGFQDGDQCILLKLRKVPKWKPKLSRMYLQNLQKMHNLNYNLSESNVPVLCTESEFSRADPAEPIAEYYPPQGFNISYFASDIEPLVMVRIIKPQKHNALEVRCRIFAENLLEFEGVQEVEFMFQGQFDDLDVGGF